MEKFTTLITENYNLQQSLLELIRTYVNHVTEDIFRIDVNETFIEVSFKPNFGENAMKVMEAYGEIIELTGKEYNILDKFVTDENSFTLKLKKR